MVVEKQGKMLEEAVGEKSPSWEAAFAAPLFAVGVSVELRSCARLV